MWICGKCGKKYSPEEYFKLKVIPVGDAVTPVCECGYRFHVDRWCLRETVEIETDLGSIKVKVSTVYLEYPHPGGLYETMIFPTSDDKTVKCYQMWRYETKEEAEKGHKKIVELLKKGRFSIIPTEYELVLEE